MQAHVEKTFAHEAHTPLGKLHPFLCSWEELEDGKILAAVEDAVQSRFPDKKVQDP